MTDSTWDRFLKEGDIIYDYIIHHFEDMFESCGTIIKQYDMRYMSYLTSGYYERVNEEYGQQVHKDIIPWIREEHQSGRLFNKENWKPFRDQLNFTDMYYGYRKLFCFHEFFFQLAAAEVRQDIPTGGLEKSINFQVALYGWTEKDNKYVKPYTANIMVDENNRMIQKHWEWN